MPRVLFGVTVPITANAFLRGQLTLLVEQGWDVHVATSPLEGFERLGELTGVTTHALPMKRQPAPLADLRALAGWLGLVRRLNPDVVVSSTPKAGLLGMVASRLVGTPTRVYHVRGLRADGLTGVMRKVSLTMERISCACSTSILCDSPSLRDRMRALGILKSDQGVVLGSGSACGVDVERFHPPTQAQRMEQRLRLQLSDMHFVVGFVGRINVDKGVRELLDACRLVHARQPELRLLLVGSKEDSTFDFSHDPWITHVEFIDDPAPMYWAFDIFCLPSYREGFPIAPLEAMASGLPVIVSDAIGCRDAVCAGETGEIVSIKRIAPLEAAIESLERRADYRVALGAAARESVVLNFNSKIVQKRFVSYLEVLSSGG